MHCLTMRSPTQQLSQNCSTLSPTQKEACRLHTRTSVVICCLRTASPVTHTAQRQPDITLQENGRQLYVFGTSHHEHQVLRSLSAALPSVALAILACLTGLSSLLRYLFVHKCKPL